MRIIDLTIDGDFNERDMLISALTIAPASGYTLADQRIGIAILDKLEAGQKLLLKETEWGWLKVRIAAQVWGRLSPKIIQLVDKINEAKEDVENASAKNT